MGELETIRVFLAVAELSSFAGAARQLGMTAAAVTRAIAGLEDRLGVQLLVRTTRQVSLTSAGAAYAAKVGPLAQGLSAAAQEIREAQGITSGHLRISAPISLGVRVLPPVLSQFAALYPDTKVALSLSDRFVDIVEEDFDLAIRVSGPPTDKSTIWRKVCQISRSLFASPDYLAANGTPQAPKDLSQFCCLSYHSDARSETWELSQGKVQYQHKVRGTLSANNGDLLAQLVMNGEGIALLPNFILDEALSAGRVVRILPQWSLPEIWLTLYYPPYEQLPLRVATFSDFFEAYVKETRPL
ncbi:LysR family transcriptional regulator [Paracoccus sp. (in: a-proteobacteria)]|uniref:LysR family transcriptional regulator n=1 Tax=Paracoccus sp. TaxID=267 RepID=UPI0028975B4B|nr:LysR family transcriptional regulator [Paracoccus sp. (in: a-proteobacteria)]